MVPCLASVRTWEPPQVGPFTLTGTPAGMDRRAEPNGPTKSAPCAVQAGPLLLAAPYCAARPEERHPLATAHSVWTLERWQDQPELAEFEGQDFQVTSGKGYLALDASCGRADRLGRPLAG